MALPNTLVGLSRDFTAAGIEPGMVLMVHSALSRVGWTVGGAATVIRALLDVLGPEGTLVMPAESPFLSDPAFWRDERIPEAWHETIRANLPLFDPRITPTTMGAVPEAFRTYPGTLRSNHPLLSVCAHGRNAEFIVSEHALEFGEGPGTPFEKLYTLGGFTLLLGVGFDRCTSLHYAESLVPERRTVMSRFPVERDGEKVWLETRDMAPDLGTHFPQVGMRFCETGAVRKNKIGEAEALFFSTRQLVDFAKDYFREALG